MAANKMDEILKHFPDLEEGWKEMEEKLKTEPSEREMLSLKYREMLQRESSKESLVESEFTKAKRAESDSKVMKAKAPERIWIDPATDLPKLSGLIDKDSVEYIRKDAFIEKADKFISSFFHPDDTELKNGILDEFHKYMKGE